MRKWTPVRGGSGSGSKAAGELILVVHGLTQNSSELGATDFDQSTAAGRVPALSKDRGAAPPARPLASSASFDTSL